MELKAWYQSKIVWLSIIQFLIAFLGLLGEFLQKADYSPIAITMLFSAVLMVVMRIWFTDTTIKNPFMKEDQG